jgi:acyl-coenzyme A synthetase/AMP-(fatty) acid ligase
MKLGLAIGELHRSETSPAKDLSGDAPTPSKPVEAIRATVAELSDAGRKPACSCSPTSGGCTARRPVSRSTYPAGASSRSPASSAHVVSTGSIAAYTSGSTGRPRWVLPTSAWSA